MDRFGDALDAPPPLGQGRPWMTTRALVLGGGGPVGVAWQTGLVAGFARCGVDLGRADHLLGTSAGALVGARLRLADRAADLADPLLAAAPPPSMAALADPDRMWLLELLSEARGAARHPAEVRRELGALALGAAVMGEEAYLDFMAGSFHAPGPFAWPQRDFACAAVDVEDGGFQVWQADSGVDLLAAVAASCAVPAIFPPVTLGGRRYMDGGMRSSTNADLAAGYDLVVILAVRLAAMPDALTGQLDEEVDALQASGATVVLITPDEEAAAVMGASLMDFGRSAEAVRAGLAQAAAQAEVLRELWG
jgi:NTE family protein